jgi:hypothetical protein
LLPWKSTGKSWSKGGNEVFIDTLKISSDDGPFDGCVTLIHAESRFARIYPFRGTVSAAETTAALADWVSSFGGVEIVRTDNGSEFRNSIFDGYCDIQKIKHVLASVNHPQSNGIVERFHRSLLNYVRVQYGNGLNWYRRALEGLRVYNRTPHKGLDGLTPLEAFHEVEMGGGIPSFEEGEIVLEDEEDVQDILIEGLAEEVFEPGQAVLWRDRNMKVKDRYPWKAGTVIEHRGRGAYKVKFGNKEKVVNRELLVAYEVPDDGEQSSEKSREMQRPASSDEGFQTPEDEDSQTAEEQMIEDVRESTAEDSREVRRSVRNRKKPKRYDDE